MSLPVGFRATPNILVNTGLIDAAAGRFAGEDAPALWSRQVLTDARLRAVAVVPPTEGELPDRFQAVHATAERVAADLDIGAVEVAVWWADAMTREALRLTSAGWAVAGYTAGDLDLLLTDAMVDAAMLADAVADWPAGNVIALASGRARKSPAAAEFAATLTALRHDVVRPRGGVA